MSVLRTLIKLSVVIACAAGSFGGTWGYFASKAEATPVAITKADPIAAKLAEDSDMTGAKPRSMSPIYPTTKYSQAQLALPTKKPIKAKVALRTKNKMPMQLASYNTPVTAYVAEPRVAERAGAIFAHIR